MQTDIHRNVPVVILQLSLFIWCSFSLLTKCYGQVGFELGTNNTLSTIYHLCGYANPVGSYFEVTNRNNRVVNTFRYYREPAFSYKSNGYSLGVGYYAEFQSTKRFSASYTLSYLFFKRSYEEPNTYMTNNNHVFSPEIKILFHITDQIHLSSITSMGYGWQNGRYRQHKVFYTPYIFSFGVGYVFTNRS